MHQFPSSSSFRRLTSNRYLRTSSHLVQKRRRRRRKNDFPLDPWKKKEKNKTRRRESALFVGPSLLFLSSFSLWTVSSFFSLRCSSLLNLFSLVWNASLSRSIPLCLQPGDVLMVVESDKADMDVEAFDEGQQNNSSSLSLSPSFSLSSSYSSFFCSLLSLFLSPSCFHSLALQQLIQ